MSACVGQQNVEGKRIPFGFKYRALPHFVKDDHSPESRGFVENSYLRGLNPQEFFFHAMGGREGLIDTAVKTAETGYIQRRLVKALEDVMVKYDGTVRNAQNSVIQFVYGEDGMDAIQVEKQTLDSLKLSDQKFEAKYRIDVMDIEGKRGLPPGCVEFGIQQEMQSIDVQKLLDQEFAQLDEDRTCLRHIFSNGDAHWPLPMNLKRFIWNAQNLFKIDKQRPSNLHPDYVVNQVRDLCNQLTVIRGDDAISLEAQKNATLLTQILIRSTLATRRVIEEFHLDSRAFDYVIGEITTRFAQSFVTPGEMVGIIAAQSIGEPATQMTLNTFHYAGFGSKNVTLGVPRLKEIINVSTNIKTPSLLVYLEPPIAKSVDEAKRIQSELEYTTLKKVTLATEIHYDPHPTNTVIEEDKEFVSAYYEIESPSNIENLSEWVLRLEMNRRVMLDKSLDMTRVARVIAQYFTSGNQQHLDVINSDDNADKLIIRCRVIQHSKAESDMETDELLRRIEKVMLEDIGLMGIANIHRVFMVDKKIVSINSLGEFAESKEWVLETDGINLKEVMCHPGVNPTLAYSNNCTEIYEVLGVEATRASLLKEIRKVIEFDGSYVNYRHLALLVDVMTSRGNMMSITRHGINRTEASALMRCSFEETVEILVDAAVVSQKDECTGVAENIILGQVAPLGTGSFEVLLNHEMLEKMTPLDWMGGTIGMSAATSLNTPFQPFSPYRPSSPSYSISHVTNMGYFSPVRQDTGEWTPPSMPSKPAFSPVWGGSSSSSTPSGGRSPGYSPSSPGYSPASPSFSAMSPGTVALQPYFSRVQSYFA
ncbi:DNA-directed RNA polymerase II subunit rpb1 [Coelomomyces lativittatus]|nr:DNA-directed RNA polymerase II subunit rpb1 [Coelomomyces lativittatus]